MHATGISIAPFPNEFTRLWQFEQRHNLRVLAGSWGNAPVVENHWGIAPGTRFRKLFRQRYGASTAEKTEKNYRLQESRYHLPGTNAKLFT